MFDALSILAADCGVKRSRLPFNELKAEEVFSGKYFFSEQEKTVIAIEAMNASNLVLFKKAIQEGGNVDGLTEFEQRKLREELPYSEGKGFFVPYYTSTAFILSSSVQIYLEMGGRILKPFPHLGYSLDSLRNSPDTGDYVRWSPISNMVGEFSIGQFSEKNILTVFNRECFDKNGMIDQTALSAFQKTVLPVVFENHKPELLRKILNKTSLPPSVIGQLFLKPLKDCQPVDGRDDFVVNVFSRNDFEQFTSLILDDYAGSISDSEIEDLKLFFEEKDAPHKKYKDDEALLSPFSALDEKILLLITGVSFVPEHPVLAILEEKLKAEEGKIEDVLFRFIEKEKQNIHVSQYALLILNYLFERKIHAFNETLESCLKKELIHQPDCFHLFQPTCDFEVKVEKISTFSPYQISVMGGLVEGVSSEFESDRLNAFDEVFIQKHEEFKKDIVELSGSETLSVDFNLKKEKILNSKEKIKSSLSFFQTDDMRDLFHKSVMASKWLNLKIAYDYAVLKKAISKTTLEMQLQLISGISVGSANQFILSLLHQELLSNAMITATPSESKPSYNPSRF